MPPEQFILSSIKKHGAIVDDTPFFSQLSEGITDACQQSGYKLKILYLLGENDELLPQIEEIQYSDCIGIILLGTEMQKEDALLFNIFPFLLFFWTLILKRSPATMCSSTTCRALTLPQVT